MKNNDIIDKMLEHENHNLVLEKWNSTIDLYCKNCNRVIIPNFKFNGVDKHVGKGLSVDRIYCPIMGDLGVALNHNGELVVDLYYIY